MIEPIEAYEIPTPSLREKEVIAGALNQARAALTGNSRTTVNDALIELIEALGFSAYED